MSVSVAIMAHPDRADYARELSSELDAPIAWDRVGLAAETCQRALEMYDVNASHHLVIQDDAIVCRDLVAALEVACPAVGAKPISLYLGSGNNRLDELMRLARQHDTPWIENQVPIWGVAIVHPTALMSRILQRFKAQTIKPDDTRLANCYRQLGVRCRFTVPSLVDHRDQLPSLTKAGMSNNGRVARSFIGESASALSLDWNSSTIIDEAFWKKFRRR